jgi:hypothetical protein
VNERGDRRRSEEDAAQDPPHEQIIDVSGPDPVIIERTEDEPEFPFATYAPQRLRLLVAGGVTRNCTIPILFILLSLCCGCIGLYAIIDNFF